MNTTFSYMYRDASNYKVGNEVVLEGECAFADIEQFLDDGMWFIPSQVGLLDLQFKLFSYDGPGEDDHVWHEILEDDFTPTDKEPNAPITAMEFIENMRKAHTNGWDVTAAMDRNGIGEEVW